MEEKNSPIVGHPRVVHGAVHSGKTRCSALCLNAMHSGKK